MVFIVYFVYMKYIRFLYFGFFIINEIYESLNAILLIYRYKCGLNIIDEYCIY